LSIGCEIGYMMRFSALAGRSQAVMIPSSNLSEPTLGVID